MIEALQPKLTFKELVAGAGGKCGSTYIDREFIEWMKEKFGDAYNNLPDQKKGPASRLMMDFEGHKRDFGKSDTAGKCYEMVCLMQGVEDSDYYEEGTVKIYEYVYTLRLRGIS